MLRHGMQNHGLLSLSAMGSGCPSAPALTLTATTAGAGNVTLHRMTPAAGTSLLIDWGDGGTTTVAAGDVGNQVHAYAGAGTWSIRVTNARDIVQMDLHDAQLSGFKSAELRNSALTYFLCYSLGAAVASVVDSADMAFWTPTTWRLNSMPAGTYAIDSADMAGWTPTTWRLFSMPAGTYAIDSADMAGWTPPTWWLFSMPAGTYDIDSSDMVGWNPTDWRLNSMPAGTYDIDSADMAGWTPPTWWLYSMPAGTYDIDSADMAGWNPTLLRCYGMPAASTTWTIVANDFAGFRACTSFLVNDNALDQTQVNALLWGMYQASVAPRTGVAGTINVGGTNAAPSGVFQAAAACPVTVATPGKEVAHELLNDGCAAGFNVWATVTFTV